MSSYTITQDILAQVQRARAHQRARPTAIEPVGANEESVWDYPRPPQVQEVAEEVRVEVGGQVLACSTLALRVVETAGAPVYYVPPSDVAAGVLRASDARPTLCEWKGIAKYFDVLINGAPRRAAAFCYPEPLDDLGQGYGLLKDYVAFYPGRVDRCTVGGVAVRPQGGGFYAGWVLPNLKGPIKGDPGSGDW